MARYIDAEPMLREAIEERKFVFSMADMFKNEIIVRTVYNDLAEFIDKQPTADVEKVRHGEWKMSKYVMAEGAIPLPVEYACSLCGAGCVHKHNYCPNCGAKMDERRDI